MALTTVYHVAGACSIKWNSNDLGTAKSGIILRISDDWVPLTCDEFGAEPNDFIYAGCSCIVEAILEDVDKVGDAEPWIGVYSALVDDDDDSQIGKLAFDGVQSTATDLGQELEITEGVDPTAIWKAYQVVPTEPSSIVLASTQENQIAIAFVVIPDANGKLFYTIPNYLN